MDAFESQILQKNVSGKDLSEAINEVMGKFGMNMLKFYFSQYESNGGQFVRTFIKYDSIQSSCKWVIRYVIREGLVIEENEKVKGYVERLNLESGKAEVLGKLLNIFLMIKTET